MPLQNSAAITIIGLRGKWSPSHPVNGDVAMYATMNHSVSDPICASFRWNSPFTCSCTPGKM